MSWAVAGCPGRRQVDHRGTCMGLWFQREPALCWGGQLGELAINSHGGKKSLMSFYFPIKLWSVARAMTNSVAVKSSELEQTWKQRKKKELQNNILA